MIKSLVLLFCLSASGIFAQSGEQERVINLPPVPLIPVSELDSPDLSPSLADKENLTESIDTVYENGVMIVKERKKLVPWSEELVEKYQRENPPFVDTPRLQIPTHKARLIRID